VPDGVSPGPLSLLVGDGTAAQGISPIAQFTPRNATELISTISRLKRPDRLYAMLTRTSPGIVIGASEMPNLPPSVLATMNNDRTAGGSKATVQTVIGESEMPVGEYVVTGSQTLSLEVIK